MKKTILLFVLPIISFCQYTTIPDQGFAEALQYYLGVELYETDGQFQVLNSDINGIESINIQASSWNISDLSGIEAFTSLETLTITNQ